MAIDPARAKSLFLAASEIADPAERAAYLDRECGEDAEIRARVEALLRANDASPLPESGPVEATRDYPSGASAGSAISDAARNRDLARAGSMAMGSPPKRGLLSMRHLREKCLALWELFFQRHAEPGPRVFPVAVGDGPGEAQHLARFFDRQTAEQVQVGQSRRGIVLLGQPGEQFVQRQEQIRIFGERGGRIQ